MMKTNLLILFSLQLFSIYSGQRVAPGVPPQQYIQQPHQVPQHQVPQHQIPQHQVPQHQVPQQQIHVQNQQQQVHQVPIQNQQHQQIPTPQQVHAHHQQGQIFNAANIAHEKEHIAEHLEVPMDTSKMSEQELQFHYFKMHDADNNNKLDGCELIKSLIHWHGESPSPRSELFHDDKELSSMVDELLESMDKNYDGYVDYAEFKQDINI